MVKMKYLLILLWLVGLQNINASAPVGAQNVNENEVIAEVEYGVDVVRTSFPCGDDNNSRLWFDTKS